MKTAILQIFLCVLWVPVFSQVTNNSNEKKKDSVKTIVASFDLRLDEVRTILWKRIFDDENIVLVTNIRVEEESFSLFEGKQFQLNKHIRLIPEIGFTYLFTDNFDVRFQTELRVSFKKFYSQINYFYQREQASVNTRSMYLFEEIGIAAGIESEDQYYGPRLEWRFSIRKNNTKKDPIPISLNANLIQDRVGFGFGINPLDFLGKKARAKIDTWEEKVNIFNQRNHP
jgi:hypothetical protein